MVSSGDGISRAPTWAGAASTGYACVGILVHDDAQRTVSEVASGSARQVQSLKTFLQLDGPPFTLLENANFRIEQPLARRNAPEHEY